MGVKEFKIIFNNPYKVYYAGETIKARILVVLDSPKRIRGMTVKIIGEANNDFLMEGQRQRSRWKLKSRENQDNCFDHEVYLSITYSIFEDSSDEDEDIELSPGEHLYPFEYVLPLDLPSSLESDLGHIRYTVESTIDCPWKFNHEIKETITVFSKYDLNTDCRASESVVVEGSKNFITFGSLFSCCYPSSPLSANFSLPVRGYVPGQTIPIKVNIKNDSRVEVSAVKLSLERHVIYRVNRPRSEIIRTKCFTIAKASKNLIERNRNVSYKQILKVPPIPPSSLNQERIMVIKYFVKLEAFVDGWGHTNLKIDTPILIGTVPLSNYQSLAGPPKENFPRKDPATGWNSVTSEDATFSPSAPSTTSSSPAPNIIPDSSTIVHRTTEDSSLKLDPQLYDEDESSKT